MTKVMVVNNSDLRKDVFKKYPVMVTNPKNDVVMLAQSDSDSDACFWGTVVKSGVGYHWRKGERRCEMKDGYTLFHGVIRIEI